MCFHCRNSYQIGSTLWGIAEFFTIIGRGFVLIFNAKLM
jgi:hypothetical protein